MPINTNDSVITTSAAAASPAREHQYATLVLLTLAYVICNLDKAMASVLLQPIKREFALSDSTLGLLTGSASTLPAVLAMIPMGLMADRFNRKTLLIVMIVLWSFSTGLAGIASSVALLFASRALVSFFEAGFAPVSMSVISDSYHPRHRSTVLGLFAMGAPVGVFMAMAVGGFIAAEYGWRPAFFIAGLPGLIMAILIMMFLKSPQRGAYDDPNAVRQAPPPMRQAFAHIVKDKRLLHLVSGMVLVIVMMAVYAIWLPTLFARTHGMNPRQAGLASAIVFGLCGAIGAAVGGAIADRIGRRGMHRRLDVAIGGTLLAASCALAALLTSSTLGAMTLFGISAFFSSFYSGPGFGVVSSIAPPAMRSTTLALLLLVINIVSVGVGSQLVGTVSDLTHATFGQQSIAIGVGASLLCSLWDIVHLTKARHLLTIEPKNGN